MENDPNMVQCANTENINCTSDPASCAFVLDKDCNKISIVSQCNVESLSKLTTFSDTENGKTSSNDPKLSVNAEDCI